MEGRHAIHGWRDCRWRRNWTLCTIAIVVAPMPASFTLDARVVAAADVAHDSTLSMAVVRGLVAVLPSASMAADVLLQLLTKF